jgi:hypothetical protein
MKKLAALIVLTAASWLPLDARAGSWGNYGDGWAGFAGVPTLTVAGSIDACTASMAITNTSGGPTYAALLIGAMPQDTLLPSGATLLVVQQGRVNFQLPAGGINLAFGCLPEGTVIFLQVMERDPVAVGGVSWTPGLIIVQ